MINLYDILEAADGQLFGEPAAQIFSDFCLDAREARPGQLFVALKTERGDGHHFMADAVANGATGIMCTHPPTFDTEGLTVVVMRSVEDALMRWSRVVLQRYGTTVVGVTGSVGKSITVAAIAQVLRTRFNVYSHATAASGRFSLPLALGGLTQDHRIAVLEFSINQSGEMAEMVEAANPMVGVVTAISRAPLDQPGVVEAVAREQGNLIRQLPPVGLAVLNFDDPAVRALRDECPAPVLTVGLDVSEPVFGADLLAYGILVDRYKTGFDLRHGADRYPGRWVPLLGAHHLYAALSALAVGISYRIPLDQGLHALTELNPLPGRMRPLDGPNGALLVDDSFTATPESTLAALEWLSAARDERGKAVFVLGDMAGPGAYSAVAHLQVGERAATVADRVVTQGEHAAEAGRAAVERGLDRSGVTLTFSAEDAARAASLELGPDDIVLVKGGPAARMERVVRRLLARPDDAALLARQTSTQTASALDHPENPSWVQVDLEAIAYNVRRLKEIAQVPLLALVRANAYGHGAVPVATTALNNGAEMLGVSSLAEALELRDNGVDASILILGHTPPWAARQVIQHDLVVTLSDAEIARAFDRAARDMEAQIRAHVLVDTGLGMMGLLPDDVTTFFRSLRNLKNLVIEGFYTDFAASDQNVDYTYQQLGVFERLIEPLLASGFRFKYMHAANSAALLHVPEARFNLARVGIAMFGLNPSLFSPIPADLRPALTWKTSVVQIKRLPMGSAVGYGSAYRTQTAQRIGVIPVGYADGFRRSPSHWKHVLIKGEYAPVVGQVGLDMTAVDLSRVEDVQIGEEVTLIGRQGHRSITVEDVADYLDTNVYEVICTLLARVPRVK